MHLSQYFDTRIGAAQRKICVNVLPRTKIYSLLFTRLAHASLLHQLNGPLTYKVTGFCCRPVHLYTVKYQLLHCQLLMIDVMVYAITEYSYLLEALFIFIFLKKYNKIYHPNRNSNFILLFDHLQYISINGLRM